MNKPFLDKVAKVGFVPNSAPYWIKSSIPDVNISVNVYVITPFSFSGRLIESLRLRSTLQEKIQFKKNFNAIYDPFFRLEDDDILHSVCADTNTTYGLIIVDQDNHRVYQIDVNKLTTAK